MGSVCIILLPTRFHNTGDFALEGHAAETDTAHLKLADVPAGAAAAAATIAHTDLELRLLQRLRDLSGACHLLCYPFFSQWKSETLEKFAAFLVVFRGCGQRDVHALDLVNAGVIDFWKHQLIFQAKCVIATTIERVRRQSTEVADPGKNHVAEPVEKFVHPVSAKRYSAADGHALANLEIGDGFLGAGDHGFLAGDLSELNRRGIQQLGVLAGFAETDVHGDLLDPWNGHDVFQAEALHQRGHRFLSVLFLHSTLHTSFIPSKILLVERGAAALACAHFRAV